MKLPAIALTCLFSASFSQAASIHNYVELGLGANKLFSFNKNTNDNLSEFSVAPSLKVLTGSRLNQSRTLWFELGYSYNGEMKYRDTKINSQSLFTGIKLSTDPAIDTSLFLRGGAGKTWTKASTLGEQDESNQSTHYYGGAGFNYRLDYKKSVVFELQHINDASSDEAINGVFLSFNQFI
ncbi:MAG: outer membrane beta-barrel protein [Bermanella sp.]|tara:strand:+ start:4149 stop:4691 length:543 start_codon:yes stop_codon:yes gene_type:complete